MRNVVVTPEGGQIRWVELPGAQPSRVYVHGLGATSPACFAEVAAHSLLAGHRSLTLGTSPTMVEETITADSKSQGEDRAAELAAQASVCGQVGQQAPAAGTAGGLSEKEQDLARRCIAP